MYEDKLSEPVRETEINRAFARLFSVIEKCEKESGILFERIQPILNGGGVENSREKIATPEFSSGLAQEMNKAVAKLEFLSESIRQTRNRVEL